MTASLAALIVLLVLVGASACSPSNPGLSGEDAPSELATSDVRNPDDALLEGELVTDGVCFWVLTDGGDEVATVWPPGFASVPEGAVTALLDGEGAVVAVSGEAVRLGGSFQPGHAGRICGPTGAEPFVAGSVRPG